MLFAFFMPASAAKLTRARAPVKGVGSEGARGGASDLYQRKVRGNGPRLCAERQPQRLRGACVLGSFPRLWAFRRAAAGPSDTAAVRWQCQATQSLRATEEESNFACYLEAWKMRPVQCAGVLVAWRSSRQRPKIRRWTRKDFKNSAGKIGAIIVIAITDFVPCPERFSNTPVP